MLGSYKRVSTVYTSKPLKLRINLGPVVQSPISANPGLPPIGFVKSLIQD